MKLYATWRRGNEFRLKNKKQKENKKWSWLILLTILLISSELFVSLGEIFFSFSPSVKAATEEKKIFSFSDFDEKICDLNLPLSSFDNPTLVVYRRETLCFEKNFLSLEEKELDEKEREQKQLTYVIRQILTDTPMESMIESISQQEKIVAAFLVGIALKESGLGKHAPFQNGNDCFNYWGFKGKQNPTKSGYSCFDSPHQAVETVGARLQQLALEQNRNTPNKMIIWKCGNSCQGHSEKSVQKWISDVNIYFSKINQPQKPL